MNPPKRGFNREWGDSHRCNRYASFYRYVSPNGDWGTWDIRAFATDIHPLTGIGGHGIFAPLLQIFIPYGDWRTHGGLWHPSNPDRDSISVANMAGCRARRIPIGIPYL